MVMSLIGQVVLLLSVVLLVMEMMILLMVRMRERRWSLARCCVRQRPDFRLGRRDWYTGRAAVRLDTLVLEMVLPGVSLMMVVMVLHRMVKGMLSSSGVLLEIEVVLLVQVLVVLQVLRFHVPHRFCKQTGGRQFSKLAVELRWSTLGRASSRDQGKSSLPVINANTSSGKYITNKSQLNSS